MHRVFRHVRGSVGQAAVFVLGLGLSGPQPAGAQDFRAKLTVTLTDPSGSAVPTASLELTNTASTEVLSGKTGDNGVYTFLFLPPGTYDLKVTANGFKGSERNGIVLQSYQASGIDIKLEVGGVSDSVTVSAEGALLQTETASRGVTVNNQLVGDLPVANHNALMLGQTLPGVFMRPLGIYTDPWTVTSQFMINGGLMYLNDFQVDGAPNNAQFGNNTYGYTPPNEAVQEVSVQGNSYDAQYGHTSGGVINVSTKSGGSRFHADGWTYLKRTGWDADSFQNNAIGAPRAPAPQTQWGLQVAGPAYIPHLIPKGSSRFQMFYLFSWDKYTELLPNALNLSYPEPEMRNGDFSKLVNGAGQPITIYDPATGTTNTSGAFVRLPFPGNVIPSNRINPIAAAVAKLMPLPNYTTPGVRYSTADRLEPGNVHHWNFYNWVSRMDFNIGSKYRLFVRPARMIFDELSNYNDIVGPGKTGGVFSRANYAILLDMVAMVSPTLVVNLRANASQYGEGWHTPDNFGYDLTKLGLPASFVNQLENPALFGQWNFSGYTSLGQSVNWNNTDTYSLQGSVTKFVGRHNVRAGADIRQTRYITYAPGYAFNFSSAPDLTQAIWNDSSSQSYSGDSFASFLLGTPSSGNALWNPAVFYKSWYIAPWLQDDWKVNNRLTLNFGLRYDLDTPPTEGYNRMNVGFNTSAPNPISSQIPAAQITAYPQLANLKGGIQFAGVNGNMTTATQTDWNNIQPRVGMAFKITPKLVFRSGYGLYYTNFQSNAMMQLLGFSATSTLVNSLNGGQTPIPNLLNNPFPNGITQPYGSSLGPLTYAGQGFTQWNPWYKMPRSHQFSAGFQYEIARNSVIDVSYVGNRTVAYSGNVNLNLPSWGFAKQCDEMAGGRTSVCNALVSNPFVGVPALQGTSLYSSSSISAFTINQPFPQFGAITESGVNLGHLWYNGLQVIFNQRLSHGLVLNTSYVRSRQIEQWGWMNQYLNLPQRSPYASDHPQVFKVTAAYDLPFGKNRTFKLHNNAVANFFLGGWQIAPSIYIQNGERANLPANAVRLHNSDKSNINWDQYSVQGWGRCVLSENANGVITPMAYSLQAGCSATDWSNYDWLAVQTISGQQVSPSGSGDLRMKPYIDSNLALSKEFRVGERLRLRLRSEATNALNHFNLLTARFDTNPNNSTFGTVLPASTPSLDAPPRYVQIGLKASW
jgi:hypothetical protein